MPPTIPTNCPSFVNSTIQELMYPADTKIGNTIRIAPAPAFESEAQTAAIEEARLSALPLETQIYFLNYAKADDIASVISTLLSPRGSVVVYRPRNALIV